MSNAAAATATKQSASTEPTPPAPPAPHPDAPKGFDVRMEWIRMSRDDLVIGGASLYGTIQARKDTSPTGKDILWSRTERHYWIGNYDNGKLVGCCEIWEGFVGTRLRKERE